MGRGGVEDGWWAVLEYPPRLVPEFPSFPKEEHGPADVEEKRV